MSPTRQTHTCNPLACPICSQLDSEAQIASLCRQRALLRRVLGEYVQGNVMLDGYWWRYERGFSERLRPATPDELALWESVREEKGK